MTETGNATPQQNSTGITELLLECRDGHRDALDRVLPRVYDELHRIAHQQLRRERDGHTLSTTALVHEAYMRLVDVTRVEWRDRVHFLSMAARAMRRILIDYAREQNAQRRGGGARPITLEEALVAVDLESESLVALDEALGTLGALNPRLVRVVECRFFGGMTEEETALALDVSSRTIRSDWVKAHRQRFDRNWAWLKQHATEIYTRHRGKYVVVAAEQKFVGDTAEEVWAQVAEAEIEDKGSFIMRVPKQGSGMRNIPPVMMVTDVTDPDELASAASQDERFSHNLAWFQEHGEEIVALYRGRWICIAGQELFATDTAREAIALARAAHPEDDGRFTYRVPTERAVRVYAH